MNKLHFRSQLFTILAVSVFTFTTSVQSSEKLDLDSSGQLVDNIFASWDRNNSPGAAVAVVRNGKVIYKRGYRPKPVLINSSPYKKQFEQRSDYH